MVKVFLALTDRSGSCRRVLGGRWCARTSAKRAPEACKSAASEAEGAHDEPRAQPDHLPDDAAGRILLSRRQPSKELHGPTEKAARHGRTNSVLLVWRRLTQGYNSCNAVK